MEIVLFIYILPFFAGFSPEIKRLVDLIDQLVDNKKNLQLFW